MRCDRTHMEELYDETGAARRIVVPLSLVDLLNIIFFGPCPPHEKPHSLSSPLLPEDSVKAASTSPQIDPIR